MNPNSKKPKKRTFKRLSTLLNSEGRDPNETIKWAYFGYGFLSAEGECAIKDLPIDVSLAKCFKVENGVYCVDGAL